MVLIAALAALAGCAHRKRARAPVPPKPAAVGYTETGIASWYGYPYHGRAAANGQTYDQEQLTAAHRTLPFDTWVRVYDLDNQKTTDVRITDRGPFVEGRIIDLSRAAARQIAMLGPGTARVRIEVIRAPANLPPAAFGVQIGAFRNRDNALRLRDRMERDFGAARLLPRPGNPPLWRVLVGSEPTQEAAAALAARIRENSPEKIACFVVRIDSN
ncbi:MAG: septal ring lytic transglycosylase RlpA family protein [Acidobacteriota bacterium]|nr:septal ring lytic transglycosylase RlpA family protein [Acidobacteriota bacterium]